MTEPAPRSPYAMSAGISRRTTAADLHAEQTLIPAADNLANAHLERQRLAAVPGRVELFTGGECHTNVVGEHAGAGNNLSACASIRS